MGVKSISIAHRLKSIAYTVGLGLYLSGCLSVRPVTPAASGAELVRTDNLALANPSGAASRDPNNYLIVRPQHVLSYGRDRGIANWPGRRECRYVFLTNIVPQAPRHNREVWKALEEYERQPMDAGNDIYIMAGASGTGGTDGRPLPPKGYATTLAGGKLTVPATL